MTLNGFVLPDAARQRISSLSNSSTLTLQLSRILSLSSKRSFEVQRELCHPKCARKVSGLSRNGPQIRKLVLYPGCLGSGARFSEDPKLFGLISGDIILFVSSKRRRLEARDFRVILIFIPFATHEKTSFIE